MPPAILSSRRVLLFSMAERGELPSALARVHPRFKTPHVAILVYATLTLALAWTGTFESTATLSAIVRLVTYGLTCGALLVLRRKRPPRCPASASPGAEVIAPVAIAFACGCSAARSPRPGPSC